MHTIASERKGNYQGDTLDAYLQKCTICHNDTRINKNWHICIYDGKILCGLKIFFVCIFNIKRKRQTYRKIRTQSYESKAIRCYDSRVANHIKNYFEIGN
jgi:hypothetical protein